MRIFVLVCWLFLAVKTEAQVITTYAGNGQPGYAGDGGASINASIGHPGGLAYDGNGNLFISALNNTIRKVSYTGIITTVAGTGVQGYSGDGGPAVNAQFNFLGGGGIACDSHGDLFVADAGNSRIRKIDLATGIVTTVAGNGSFGYYGDGGSALSAILYSPTSVAFDESDNLYILDASNYRIRKIDVIGNINTIAGNGISGTTGEGGQAVNAQISPSGFIKIEFDHLYTSEGVIIRKIDLLTGIITRIAGTGIGGYSGDGTAAVSAQLSTVMDATEDVYGNVYIADEGNRRIRKIGTDGIIQTVAGTGMSGYNGDSILANTATLFSPRGIELDSCANLYIADNGNYRIRKIIFHPDCFPTNINRALPISFSIYPNPVHSQVTVTGERLKGMTITNTLGQVILQKKCNGDKTVINMNDYSAGIYFITVSDQAGQKLTKKLLKE